MRLGARWGVTQRAVVAVCVIFFLKNPHEVEEKTRLPGEGRRVASKAHDHQASDSYTVFHTVLLLLLLLDET